MSDLKGLGLLNAGRDNLVGRPGKEKLTYWRELRPIVNELLKADGQKPKGRLSQDAVDAILGIREEEGATQAAKEYIQRIKAEAPQLLWKAEQPAGVTTIRPGHTQLPVFINKDGWAVPSATIEGQPRDAKTLLAGVYALEEAIRRQLRLSRYSLNEALPMGLDVKSKMIEKLISSANMTRGQAALPGLNALQTLELRSSSFTNLLALAATLDPARDADKRLIGRVHTFLLELTNKEPDRWLGDHMSRMLNYPAYTQKLDAEQKVLGMDAWESRHRQKFEVKNIMDADGFVRWDHVCGEGEGFFESFKVTMQNEAVHGARFTLVEGSERYGSYDLMMTFNPPKRTDGQVINGIKMHVRAFRHDDMFDAVGKNIGTRERPVYQGFSYGGHSSIGENQERSLKAALAEGKKASSPQIGVLDLCAGLDNLDADIKALGDIDLMTTHDSSYFSKGPVRDRAGKIVVQDGVPRSEGQDILIELLTGLTAGENYQKIHDRFENVIPRWQHPEAPNTHTPIFPNYEKVLNFHLDADGDGVMDARDIHYHCHLTTVTPDLQNELKLKPLPEGLRSDLVKGTAAMNAVLDLNVATHYHGNIHHEEGIVHKFVADGFFDGEGQKDLMRFYFDEVSEGTRGILVQYNSQLAHTTREALEALTMYQSMMTLADRADQGGEPSVRGLSEVDRKLMALAFAVFRLNYDGPSTSNDERIWKQLLETARLPPTLSYRTLQGILDPEMHDYSGNMAMVSSYKEGLSAEVLRQLEKRDVGRPIGDPLPA
jgi:hypothetical protein